MAAQQHHNVAARTYAERAQSHTNPAARVLLETAERKRSNLCVSVDVTKKADLLRVVDAVGPDVCLIKVRMHSIGSLRCGGQRNAPPWGCFVTFPDLGLASWALEYRGCMLSYSHRPGLEPRDDEHSAGCMLSYSHRTGMEFRDNEYNAIYAAYGAVTALSPPQVNRAR